MSRHSNLLAPIVQKWIFKQGWQSLRDIQEQSIPPILSGDRDVLISASTAAGKTEAFFLPACSAVMNSELEHGFDILYVSPLKALINDQYRRLESLCEMLDMSVTPWHGDSSQGLKNQARKNPSGIVLITPESLESLLIRQAGWVRNSFSNLKYIVIDEFHAFIGSDRGYQLISLLTRLEQLLGRFDHPIPRVALSATLGELNTIPILLRPNRSIPCEILTSSENKSSLKLQVRGYIEPLQLKSDKDSEKEQLSEKQICADIFRLCRGDSHLVFANSRTRTEGLAARLSDLCEENVVPNEFFPHHGSLAKELREGLESRLQQNHLPTTAICTTTLELGIDIGKVCSVIQAGAPQSVSSLRQRLGRSGRRGSAATLRMMITEKELSERSTLGDLLRLELVQSIAMIRLLIASKWFEPADSSQMHFSTLLHQVLALTAQWGGVRADQLHFILCKIGPFQSTSVQHFKQLLGHMGQIDLLTQLESGELVLGREGERLVSHYTFFAVFKTPEEFRMIFGAKVLGTLPIDSLVIPEQHIIFGGKRWYVQEIDKDKKVIYVEKAKGGDAPQFNGNGLPVHSRIRQEMKKIYTEADYRIDVGGTKVDFIDSNAQMLFHEGVRYFHDAKLHEQSIIQHGNGVCIFTWQGDRVDQAISVALQLKGFKSEVIAGCTYVSKSDIPEVMNALHQVSQSFPSHARLAAQVPQKHIDKYDEYLADELLNEGYGVRMFDVDGAVKWVNSIFD